MSTKEFNYTREWTDAEAFPLLSFTKNWENPDDYPTIETDEQKVRQDMQSLHDEVKDFLNNELIPRVIAEDATVEGWEAQETARTEAETARSKAETARTEAEQGRADAEDARAKSETNRADAEANRESAEQSRVTAEAARVSAEQARVDSTNGIVAQATAQANAAKTSADGAKASATAAASSATSASNSASNAASSASSAASSSSSASSSASAARAAQAAAEKARDEAQGAAGGDFATKTEAKGYANTAEANAKSYTDQKISAIPTPDVSGQINAHNADVEAHPAIQKMIADKKGAQVYEAVIGTAWTENEDTGVKTQTVTIAGITAENTAKVDHSSASVDGTSDGYATFVEEENQYLTYITNGFADTVAGGIKFTIFGDAPTVSIPIIVEVV